MKFFLHRSKFGENLLIKDMLTQSMRQNLPVNQNKSRLLGRRGVRTLCQVFVEQEAPIYAYLNLPFFLGGAFQGGILGASVFFIFTN